MNFADYVKNFRAEKSLSVDAMAAGLGYSYQAIYDWMDGVYQPQVYRLFFIANHAPAESWQREFASKAVELLAVCNSQVITGQ